MPAEYIKQIFDTLMLAINKEDVKEITIEVNPNSVDEEKMRSYKEIGINRISIGLQSTYDTILKKIGRAHNLKDFEDTLELANKIGFKNISVDLIYPLPDLDLEKFKESVEYVINLKDKNVKHISIYNLEVHENTKLAFLLKEGYVTLVDEDTEYEMYEYLRKRFEEEEYHRYEISNYAIDGYESKHNLRYWNQELYLGFGCGASSFFSGTRYSNIKNIEKYIENIETGNSIIDKENYEELDLLALMKEYVMLSLRKIEGLDKKKFKAKYKKDIEEIFAEEIKELTDDKLIEEKQDKILLTKRGLEVANLVWEKFV